MMTRSGFTDVVGLGGRLCLDFVNTIDCRRTPRAIERLSDYLDLLEWARVTDALLPAELDALNQAASRRPSQAANALCRAIGLREAIYDVLSRIPHAGWPTKADAARLDDLLGPLIARTRIGFSPSEPLAWSGQQDDLERIGWVVANSFVQLVHSTELQRVRECADPDCHWLFVDRTKNGSRRWCSMAICGASAKNRRYYARRKTA